MRTGNKTKVYMGDFETTVYENQTFTEVWASACVEIGTEDVHIFNSIAQQFDFFKSLRCNIICYYHNLKFDGSFWLSYLVNDLSYEQAYDKLDSGQVVFVEDRYMKPKTFKYLISDMGQWYTIKIKIGKHYLELRDSLKMIPFSVKDIGAGFKTKHRKTEITYSGYRYAGCEITEKEKEYIANDVLVVAEALEYLHSVGYDGLTIGSCCFKEYRNMWHKTVYDEMFPDVYSMKIDKDIFGSETAGEYIKKSYKGGWCYLVKGKEKKVYKKGTTADVNSLYPSVMHSESGNRFPVGLPIFWEGDIPKKVMNDENLYYFVRLRTRFKIKPNFLPFIQIKGSFMYDGKESLETSNIYDSHKEKYYRYYIDKDGKKHDTTVELTLTKTDYLRVLEHYYLLDCEILDGCFFNTELGIFDAYIDKYKKQKIESKGAKRGTAKLALTNLYGKFATNTNSSFKVAYIKEDKSLGFYTQIENNKKPGYIPIGSAITSYARDFTIRAAQKNYYGVDKPGFIYADTDSIHCDLPPDKIKGIEVHETDFCKWKLESCWDTAFFTRQKTYIEHVTHENLEQIDEPYYNIKCAGMPENSKKIFREKLENGEAKLEDFDIGLKLDGKLKPKRIPGGVILVDTPYEMRGKKKRNINGEE